MGGVRKRLAFGVLVLLVLALSSCQPGSADGDLASVSTAIHPADVTAVRWLADRSVADLEGSGRSSCRCSEPSAIAREAPEDPLVDCAVVCLNGRGFLIARMSVTFTNGPGVDLLVYEWGSRRGGTDDRFSVYVSTDGHQWITAAEAISNDSDQLYASIDLGDEHDDYLYVKIVPSAGAGRRYIEGPEILAIEALHPSVELEF